MIAVKLEVFEIGIDELYHTCNMYTNFYSKHRLETEPQNYFVLTIFLADSFIELIIVQPAIK